MKQYLPTQFFQIFIFLISKHRLSALYRARLGYANLDCVKAPGIDDRKRVNINNMNPFAIVDPRELSRSPHSHNLSARGINADGFSEADRELIGAKDFPFPPDQEEKNSTD